VRHGLVPAFRGGVRARGLPRHRRATLTASPTHREARLLRICDRSYGRFAALILVVGFLRVCLFEKGSSYYFSNPFFHAKLGLFIGVGLLSIPLSASPAGARR
jgi:uncharacterized membrane protein